MTQIYGDGTDSTIGNQFNTFLYQKNALKEAKKTQFFSQMADVTSMPKNMGKKIKKYHYLPLLDDANINDQGIDAAGNQANYKATFALQAPGGGVNATNGMNTIFITGEGASSGASLTAAKSQAKLESAVLSGNFTVVAWNTDWATTITAYVAAGWLVSDDGADAAPVVAFPYQVPVFDGGNLYGSSKDVGTISAKLPSLSETGGRVNRVGYSRVELEGSFEKFGFFDEYTKESMDFDTDAELEMHVHREMVMAASEMTEDALQVDLLNNAGVIRFGGIATQASEINGESGTESDVTYDDLMRLNIDLDNNRTPKGTKMITGTRMTDTKTVNGARPMFIGSELIPTVKSMVDNFSNPAFISVEKYAAGGTVAEGEIGQIDQFKLIVVPEMMHWQGGSTGGGATVTTNTGYRETDGSYDVFPMLVVGGESFTTIGFQTDGKSVKFKIKHIKPESDSSYSLADDPFGEKGFMSIKWYYGFMVLRPERIAVVKCAAKW